MFSQVSKRKSFKKAAAKVVDAKIHTMKAESEAEDKQRATLKAAVADVLSDFQPGTAERDQKPKALIDAVTLTYILKSQKN